jgi:endogenous inhibitor of DNA gyrase (YacG/DUF329 family)
VEKDAAPFCSESCKVVDLLTNMWGLNNLTVRRNAVGDGEKKESCKEDGELVK